MQPVRGVAEFTATLSMRDEGAVGVWGVYETMGGGDSCPRGTSEGGVEVRAHLYPTQSLAL